MDVDWSLTTNCLTHSSQNTMQIHSKLLLLWLWLASHYHQHHNIPLCETIDFTNVRRYHFSTTYLRFICMLYTILLQYILHRSIFLCCCAPSFKFIIFYSSNSKKVPIVISAFIPRPRYSRSKWNTSGLLLWWLLLFLLQMLKSFLCVRGHFLYSTFIITKLLQLHSSNIIMDSFWLRCGWVILRTL